MDNREAVRVNYVARVRAKRAGIEYTEITWHRNKAMKAW